MKVVDCHMKSMDKLGSLLNCNTFGWLIVCMALLAVKPAESLPPIRFLLNTLRTANDAQYRDSKQYLSPNDFLLAYFTPVQQPSEEALLAMQMPNLFEGDIVGVAGQDLYRLRDDPVDVISQPQNSALNLETYPDKLWPKGRIPYELSNELSKHIVYGELERVAVAQAFEEYKNKTCIRFVPRRFDDYDYIHITRNVNLGCSSYVGRAGGNQTVSLEISKCFTKGIVAHELMHALGFFHEHSRPDRDQFVNIIENNIKPGMIRNFEKYPNKIIDTLNMPYDYDSVMHYHQLAFSKNGRATIEPVDSTAKIGQRFRLSEVDAAKVNRLYNCEVRGKPTPEQQETTTVPVTVPAAAGTTTTKPTESSEKEEECRDLNEHCALWGEIGHCKWSEKYMSHYCKQSCHLCASTASPTVTQSSCVDQNLFCGYWSRIGECETESKFMKIFCKKSCNICKSDT